jgi:hypothetical protein
MTAESKHCTPSQGPPETAGYGAGADPARIVILAGCLYTMSGG